MSLEQWSEQDKDRILLKAFRDLEPRGFKSDWAKSASPFTELKSECESLMRNESFAKSIDEYLRLRSILRRSVEIFFTYIAMSARADWKNVPDSIRPVTARGCSWGVGFQLSLSLMGQLGDS